VRKPRFVSRKHDLVLGLLKTYSFGALSLHNSARACLTHAADGGFHIKAGILNLDRPYFAAKVNANFPQNSVRFGLPLIQGVIALCDAENGYLLAMMDSIEITIQRTGAATAVAAKDLARPESKTLTICGCGNQGRVSFRALHNLFPFKEVCAFDLDHSQAETFISELSGETTARVILSSNWKRQSDKAMWSLLALLRSSSS